MRHVPVTSLTGIVLLVQPFSPTAAGAQEPSDTTEACTVQMAARALDAGLSAVQVWAYFSRDIGRVHGLRVSEESGVTLASPDLLERIRVRREDDQESEGGEIRPIVMGPEPNSARLWLDLFEAEAGEYDITIEGEAGRCRGTIRVDG